MIRGQELCESRGGRPGLPIPNGPYGLCRVKAKLPSLRAQKLCESRGGLYGLCGRKVTLKLKHQVSELRSCVKVEVAVLGSPSLMVLMVSVDVKQH